MERKRRVIYLEPKRGNKQPSKVVYDRISELPDGIIEDILSRLTMKESARTSVLAWRWKDMWTYSTTSFDFDSDFGSKALIKKQINIGNKKKRDIYVNCVNKILKAHKGSSVEEFKVEFNLKSTHKSDIDNWIEFAVRKGVKKLELKLEPFYISPFYVPKGAYQLNVSPFKAVKMMRLKSLCLEFVNVTGEVLEYLLMPENCPFLEIVHITYSESLVDVRVVAPCLKLKHFEIQFCHLLRSIYIHSAPNLMSVLIQGEEKMRVCLREVPNLKDVTISGDLCTAVVVTENFNQLSIPLSQIEKLNLCLDTTLPEIHDFPVLKNLKQLKLEFGIVGNRSVLLSCSAMIKACPDLHTFSITMNFSGYEGEDREVLHCQNCRIHENLKVVEFRSFRGTTRDVELATYLLSTSPYLEMIIVDTCYPILCGNIVHKIPGEESDKECMRSLAKRLSPTAELVLL